MRRDAKGEKTMLPSTTLIFAAIAALVNLWLGIRCGRVRAAEKISHGDGGNPLLQRRMRAQLNFAENTPLVVILTLLLEISLGHPLWLTIVAVVYIIARILHALGMDSETGSWMRTAGVAITMLVIIGLSIAALLTGYGVVSNVLTVPASVTTPV